MIRLILFSLLLMQRTGPLAPGASGTVAGRLTYADGTPAIAYAMSLVLPTSAATPAPAPGFPLRTDINGRFRFSRVAPGRYTLRMDYPGGIAIYYPGLLAEAGAMVLNVTAGSTTDDLEFRLPSAANGVRISGRVVFPPNYVKPPLSPEVQVSDGSYPLPIPIAADGRFEILHVRPGTYPLLVSPAPGMQPVRVPVATRDVENVELVVPRLVDVVGTVTTDDRTRPNFTLSLIAPKLAEAPVPAATDGSIVIRPPGGDYRPLTTPAGVANGTFAARLPEAEYRITAQGLPAGYYFRTMTAGGVNLLDSPLKIVGTEPVRVAITLGRSAGVQVRGRVKDPAVAVAPTSLRRVILVDAIQLSSMEARVADDGTFEFERVMPGSYLAQLTLTSSIGSAFGAITIPDRNVSDLEIASPALKEITGRVAVDGAGSRPRARLLLVRGGDSLLVPGPTPSSLPTLSPAATNVRAGISDTQVLLLDVNALPDGTFKIRIPEGRYRVAVPANQASVSPLGFFLREVSYGSSRLTSEPLIVTAEDNQQLFLGFGTTAPNPWVKVGGRVVGMNTSKGPYNVLLTGNGTSPAEAFVDPDGRFEFPRVLQGVRYTASLVPENPAALSLVVDVRDKDVTDVELFVPAEREVTVRTSVEGNAPVPVFALALRASGPGDALKILIKPESDGTFKAKLPEDERQAYSFGLPLGYSIKTMTYGSTNLLRQPLNLSASAAAEIVVVLEVDPAVPMGSVRGRVKGLDPDTGSVQLVLNGIAAYASFEAPLSADGSFAFTRIPQGSYVPSLKGGVAASRLSPSIVTVTGTDLLGVEIEAPKKGASRSEPIMEEAPTGARLSDMNGGARETANESAAASNLRTINTALVIQLETAGGRYVNLAELVNAGLIDRRFLDGPVSGFHYSVVAMGRAYAAVAIPVGEATGRYGMFSNPDAVVRYSTFEGLAPPRQAGNPVQ